MRPMAKTKATKVKVQMRDHEIVDNVVKGVDMILNGLLKNTPMIDGLVWNILEFLGIWKCTHCNGTGYVKGPMPDIPESMAGDCFGFDPRPTVACDKCEYKGWSFGDPK